MMKLLQFDITQEHATQHKSNFPETEETLM